MAGNLLRREDRLLHAAQCADLAKLAALHIAEPLGVLRQPHMTHAPLHVVDEPPLAVGRNHRDRIASDIADIFKHPHGIQQVLVATLALDALLTHLNASNGNQLFLETRVSVKVALRVFFLLAVKRLPDADSLAHLLDAVILGDIHDIGRQPVELVLMDFLRPTGWIVSPFGPICLAGHACEHEAPLGVGLVLALGLQVEEHAGVCVEDRLDHDALALVVGVLVILVYRAQPKCAETAADRLLKSVVVGFVGHAILLVATEQVIAKLGGLVVLVAVRRKERDADAVVAVLVDDPHDRAGDLVDLELRLVLKLLAKRAFPLRPGDGVEPAILQALQPLVAQGRLDRVELLHGLRVDVGQPLIVGNSRHFGPFPAGLCYQRCAAGNASPASSGRLAGAVIAGNKAASAQMSASARFGDPLAV